MNVTKLEQRSPESCEYHAQQNGIVVGVHPVTDKREAKEIFKVNLQSKGLLPILLVANNRNASTSFILAKDRVHVLDEATHIASSSQVKNILSGTAGAATATAGAAAISLPLVIAGLKMASDATVIQHNLADKEYQTRTLGPGQSAQGFIFFQFPPASPPTGVYHVLAEARASDTGEQVPFDFNVRLTPKNP